MHTRLLRTLVPLLALATALAFLPPATAEGGDGNIGTIKVHDEEVAAPPQRNEPHVDCQDFWVEGFNLASGSGTLTLFSWPPTGGMEEVDALEWEGSAEADGNGFHLLVGPLALPGPGHYRVEVDDGDALGGAKTKMFWVEPCEGEGLPPEEMPCPTGFTATANADGSVTLEWVPAPGSDGTNVYRALGEGDLVYVTTLGAGATTYTDRGLALSATYAYAVTGFFVNQESCFTEVECPILEVTTIPELPGAALLVAAGLGAVAVAIRRRK